MITGWRDAMGAPFLFFSVTLLAGDGATSDLSEYFRLEQQTVLTLPGTGYVTAADIGERQNSGQTEVVHPRFKLELGRRHALMLMRNVDYTETLDYGPVATGRISIEEFEGNQYARVEFLAHTAHNMSFEDTPSCPGCCASQSPFQYHFGNGWKNPTEVILDRSGAYLRLDHGAIADLFGIRLMF